MFMYISLCVYIICLHLVRKNRNQTGAGGRRRATMPATHVPSVFRKNPSLLVGRLHDAQRPLYAVRIGNTKQISTEPVRVVWQKIIERSGEGSV